MTHKKTPIAFLRTARRGLLCAAMLGLCGASAVQAASLRALSGQVQIVRNGVTVQATPKMRLKKGDVLQSSADADGGGEALVRFDDGARLALRSGSALELRGLRLQGPETSREKIVALLKGSLRYISSKATVRQKVSFVTSTATIGIRGTDIEIVVTEEAVQDNNPGTYLKVNTGAAVLTAPDGANVEVAPGEVAYGGEPELTARGAGGSRRASARKVGTTELFKASNLDRLMR